MPPKVVKRKKSVMTLDRKREIIGKIEEGVSMTAIMAQYNVAKSTLYDIRKSAGSVKKFHDDFAKETKHKKERKTMKKPSFPSVDEATFRWVKQQRTAGVMVRGVEPRCGKYSLLNIVLIHS